MSTSQISEATPGQTPVPAREFWVEIDAGGSPMHVMAVRANDSKPTTIYDGNSRWIRVVEVMPMPTAPQVGSGIHDNERASFGIKTPQLQILKSLARGWSEGGSVDWVQMQAREYKACRELAQRGLIVMDIDVAEDCVWLSPFLARLTTSGSAVCQSMNLVGSGQPKIAKPE